MTGWLVRPSRAGTLAFLGLCGLTLGAVLGMFNPPGVHAETNRAINRAGYAVTTAAVGCFAAGEIVRRRNRTTTAIELRTNESPATLSSLEEFRRGAEANELWIVSESAFPKETLAEAAQAGVRCYVERHGGFEEVTTVIGGTPDEESVA